MRDHQGIGVTHRRRDCGRRPCLAARQLRVPVQVMPQFDRRGQFGRHQRGQK